MINPEFSVGALKGWHGVLLGLFGSAVLLLSGRQDLNKFRRQKSEIFGLGAFFWFSLALLFAGAVVWLGIGGRMWEGAFLGTALFCVEGWLIYSWWRNDHTRE